MATYEALLSDDPAWPELAAAARECGRVTVLPRDATAARACLEKLQVTTRSTLGALAHETGGGDRTLGLYPPPWTQEGKNLATVSRRPVPAREVWDLQQELARQRAR
jgi:hypothetical protein